uniref:WGS project CAEQ00000000 data, annotated contig 1004 n=1 Tax=Trypanosoma congolense (strain IL3000) TaxID=1068625 RepID=F9W361_TRYCI|nr:unnamed protein product [Trypanosoma congolense IL3000]
MPITDFALDPELCSDKGCSVDAAGPTAKFSAVDCASDFSEGTLQAQIRSVVEAVLNESHFPWRAAEVAEQRKEQRRALKAFKQECRQRCTALEEKLRFALEAIESTGSSLAELRAGCFMAEAARSAAAETGCLASSPREQLFAQPSTRMNSPFAKATTKGASADSEQHLMDLVLRRTKRFTEACEERCVQRVALEITQPLAEHVRRLISAHQSMVDTVVESRCEQLEGRITRTLQQQQMQLKELGSRLGGLRSDVQSALRDFSEKLDVACPGL